MKHPGAVLVVDDDVAEDGAAFLVMELLDGVPCDQLWGSLGMRMSPRVASAIAIQLLGVLAAAHEKGIIHRDIKPANLFLTRVGVVKVLDFGIARAREAIAGAHATGSGLSLGTPAFMAPEHARGRAREMDGRTDLWAAGATFFAMVTGELVHAGETSGELLIAAATRPARALRAVVPSVPVPIAQVIDRALAFERGDRWPTAEAMREALTAAHRVTFGEDDFEKVVAAAVGEHVPRVEQARPVSSPAAETRTRTVPALSGTKREATAPPSPTSAAIARDRAPLAGARRWPIAAAGAIAVAAVGGAIWLKARPAGTAVADAGAVPGARGLDATAITGARDVAPDADALSGTVPVPAFAPTLGSVSVPAAPASAPPGPLLCAPQPRPRSTPLAVAGSRRPRPKLQSPLVRRFRGPQAVQIRVPLMNRRTRLAPPLALGLSFAMASALATTSRPSLAADKAECLAAASKGQTLRDAHALLEAREQFRTCARRECPEIVETDCGGWLDAVERALPTVVLSAKDGEGRDLFDVKVTADGAALAQKLDGQAVPMNPGVHSFRFELADGTSATSQVLVKEGEKAQGVAVVLRSAGAAAVVSAGPAKPAETMATRPASRGGVQRVLGIVLGGAGIVALGIGGGIALDAKAKDNAAEGEGGLARQTDSRSDAGAGNVATAVVLAGAVVAATGVVLAITAPRGKVSVGTDGRGVLLKGTF